MARGQSSPGVPRVAKHLGQCLANGGVAWMPVKIQTICTCTNYLYAECLFLSENKSLDTSTPKNSPIHTYSHKYTAETHTVRRKNGVWSFLWQEKLTKKHLPNWEYVLRMSSVAAIGNKGKNLRLCSRTSKVMFSAWKVIYLTLFSSHITYQSRSRSCQYFNK